MVNVGIVRCRSESPLALALWLAVSALGVTSGVGCATSYPQTERSEPVAGTSTVGTSRNPATSPGFEATDPGFPPGNTPWMIAGAAPVSAGSGAGAAGSGARPAAGGVTSECAALGYYQAGKGNPRLLCCPGLNVYFFLSWLRGPSDGYACVDVPIVNYACLPGECGNGICEKGEAEPCVCVQDCPQADASESDAGAAN
jgi:hypothetical protein